MKRAPPIFKHRTTYGTIISSCSPIVVSVIGGELLWVGYEKKMSFHFWIRKIRIGLLLNTKRFCTLKFWGWSTYDSNDSENRVWWSMDGFSLSTNWIRLCLKTIWGFGFLFIEILSSKIIYWTICNWNHCIHYLCVPDWHAQVNVPFAHIPWPWALGLLSTQYLFQCGHKTVIMTK